MIEISPSYALNKSNVNILDIQAFYAENRSNIITLDIRPLYTENQPKIEVATSDISGAITALAAAQEAERLRNQTENFYQLTNDNKILATEAATQAQLWAEGEEPGGPGTRSAKAWVESIPAIIGTDIKTLTIKQGDLTSLSTTAKGNLVAAINELYDAVGGAGAQINDTAGSGDTSVTWSADKIYDTIEAAKLAIKNDLVNGASAALDTLSELASALNNDPSFAVTIATELGNRVRFDSAQTLTAAQKLQACTNIGIGDPERDLVAAYVTAKA